MAAQVVKRLPEGDDWIYELKFDGYRALIIKDKQRVELRSRKNKDLTGMYPGDRGAGQRLNADQAVVDGEIVALDARRSPSSQRSRAFDYETSPRTCDSARESTRAFTKSANRCAATGLSMRHARPRADKNPTHPTRRRVEAAIGPS